MSAEALTAVLHHSRAKGTAKVVLIGIANHAGDGGAWPALNTLAKYANTDVRTVQRALRSLEDSGELVTEVQAGGTHSMRDEVRPNRYIVAVRCPVDCDGSLQHKTRQGRLRYPVTPASPGDAHVTPPGDAHVTPPGDASVTLTRPSNPTMNTGCEEPSPQSAAQPVDNHRCQRGWLDEDDDGRRRPCLVCKPHLRARS